MYERVALQSGAAAYVCKRTCTADLLSVIRAVLQQRPAHRRRLGPIAGMHVATSGLAALTPREVQIFHLIGEGRSTHEIAGLLAVSPNTIDTHCEHIKAKLTLRTGNELVRAAVQWLGVGSYAVG